MGPGALFALLPPGKDSPINVQLPEIKTPKDVLQAIGCVTRAIAMGEITPSEGEALAKVLNINANAIELYKFESVLNQLEK